MVADDPTCKIELKGFHGEILNDHQALKKEEESYAEIPMIRQLNTALVQHNYLRIKQDVQDKVHSEMEWSLNDPSLTYLMLRK